MTLFKQIAITVSMIIIILLSSVMYINYNTTKNDIIETLYQTTVNNISTLSSKIAQASEDNAIIASTIDSEFDSGYYNKIEFISNTSSFKYTQIDNKKPENIPTWFIELTNLDLPLVSTNVTQGWNIIGKIIVIGDKNIAYTSLYKVFTNLFYLFLLFVSITLALLYIIIHFILKPLKAIQNQAENIAKNEFVVQDKIPFTTEFKDVVNAMNIMVKKVEYIFNQSTKTTKENKELLYIDHITRLYNRRYLMLKLLDTIKLENKTGGGCGILISLNGAEILNTKLGRVKTDEIFLEISNILKDSTRDYEHSIISRINATEFMLILPNCQNTNASNISNNINIKFAEILKKHNLDYNNIFINIAIYRYKSSIKIKDLLTYLDHALDISKAQEDSNIFIYENDNHIEVLQKEQWRGIINNSMSKNNFLLKTRKCINTKNNTLNHNVITFTIHNNDIEYLYGDFMPSAISFGLVSSMYCMVLNTILNDNKLHINNKNLTFRLSNEFLQDLNSFDNIKDIFKKFKTKDHINLIFEVHNIIAIKHTKILEKYIKLFNKYGYSFSINSFTNESNDFEYLKRLKPIYLKSDCAFLFDQPTASINSINTLANSLGIKLIATYVKELEDINKLKEIDIFNIQGPITDKLNIIS